MNIRKHINLINNHGYKGKIGLCKESIAGMCMSARPGDVVLYQPYTPGEYDDESTVRWALNHCTIEKPYSEYAIQERLKSGNGIKTHSTCVGVPLIHIEEIEF